uniref:Uncharacterized protein n=1 Tax=Cereibacter sphaeroides (strain ATCC 17025 / ATH 2.4.3) TaxID=349102 RepID=A4WPM2_CERS5
MGAARHLLRVRLVGPLAPLLEQERHARGLRLIAQGSHPIRVHRPRVAPALAPDDDPVESGALLAARPFIPLPAPGEGIHRCREDLRLNPCQFVSAG